VASGRQRSTSFIVCYRGDRPEQTIGLAVRTGSEVERVGARFRAAAQGHGPQPLDINRPAVHVPDWTEEFPVGIEYVDPTVAEIADQDSPLNRPKGWRSTCSGRRTPMPRPWSRGSSALPNCLRSSRDCGGPTRTTKCWSIRRAPKGRDEFRTNRLVTSASPKWSPTVHNRDGKFPILAKSNPSARASECTATSSALR
jgi:hypothetical protein